MGKDFGIPQLHVIIQQTGNNNCSSEPAWRVILLFPDSNGERKLGYRRSGTLRDNTIFYDKVTEVHDADRDVWTQMNPSDRPDVQKRIDSIVRQAVQKWLESGNEHYERLIK